jgi:transposase
MNYHGCMARIHLSDRQWAFIQPLLPPPAHTGRPRADDRRTIEGMLYVFRRLLIRWEHHLEVYRSFFVLALLLICVRRLSAA